MSEPDQGPLLPPAAERSALVQILRELVECGGYEHLALSILVQPDARHFPDRWSGGEPSVQRLIQRLLIYADLPDLAVQALVEDDLGLGPASPVGVGSSAWVVRNRGKASAIAVRASALRDPWVLVPGLARSVAEIWRTHHGLVRPDLGEEQRHVDVTAIYLGFGLLTVPAAVRHSTTRTGGRTQATVARLGLLDPRGMAFCLAVIAQVRELNPAAIKAIKNQLGATPGAFFSASLGVLQPLVPPITAALGLPPRASWPDPPELTDLTQPLPEPDDAGTEIRRDEDRGVLGMNEGTWVFRVERSKAKRLARMLALPVVLLGMLAARQGMGIEIAMWKVLSLAAALGLAGLVIGRFMTDSRCSEPKCGEPLTPTQEVCPRCGGRIGGVIHHPKERLAAAEQLAAEQAAAGRTRGTEPSRQGNPAAP